MSFEVAVLILNQCWNFLIVGIQFSQAKLLSFHACFLQLMEKDGVTTIELPNDGQYMSMEGQQKGVITDSASNINIFAETLTYLLFLEGCELIVDSGSNNENTFAMYSGVFGAINLNK